MPSAWKADRIRSATTTIFAEMSALAWRPNRSIWGKVSRTPTAQRSCSRQARAAIAGGMNQYPPGRGILPLRQAIAAHSSRTYGLSYRPGNRDPRHDGRHRGTGGVDSGVCQSGRRGHCPGALLRLLRRLYRTRRWATGRGGTVRAGLPAGSRRAVCRIHAEDQSAIDQLTTQPHRRGAGSRRSCRDRGAGGAARRAGHLRRGI